jgi:hypothetical protein
MTPAEKQRRYRERKFGNKPAVTKSSVAKELAEVKAELARERQEHQKTRDKLGNKDTVTKQPPTKREMEAQFEQRVEAAAREMLDYNIRRWLDEFRAAERRIKDFDQKIGRYKPIVSRRTLRFMLAGAQPDRGGTHAAAVEVNASREAIEIALCGSEAEQLLWERLASLPSVEGLMAQERRSKPRTASGPSAPLPPARLRPQNNAPAPSAEPPRGVS